VADHHPRRRPVDRGARLPWDLSTLQGQDPGLAKTSMYRRTLRWWARMAGDFGGQASPAARSAQTEPAAAVFRH
jgi:hypothetical protein